MKRSIKKYWAIYIVGIQNAINYRAELMLWSVIDAMPLVGALVLWLNALEGGVSVAGYDQSAIVVYFVAGYIAQQLTGSFFDEDGVNDIRDGTFVRFLVKPVSFKRRALVREASWKTALLFSAVLPVVVLAVLFVGNILPGLQWYHLWALPTILLMGYLVEYSLTMLVLIMAFVFEQAHSLRHLKWMLGWIFSGRMIPPELMPKWLASMVHWLPFKYRFYTPVQIYFGNFSTVEIMGQIVLGIAWIIGLIWVVKWLWNRNLKQFTAAGN